MSIHFIVLIIGLFGVPLWLLKYSHGVRKRRQRDRNLFWGAVTGHCVAATLAVISALITPEAWTSEDSARGFFGIWSLLVFPLAGALVGALKPVRETATFRSRRTDAPPS